jgi:hypothetical protein
MGEFMAIHCRLKFLWEKGEGESKEADDLREKSEIPWLALSRDEKCKETLNKMLETCGPLWKGDDKK